MNGGAVALAVAGGELNVTVSAVGVAATDVQVKYMGGLPLTVGKTYRLSFDARADSARTMDTSVWENGHDLDGNGFAWSTYHYDTHPITTSMSTYTVDFTMPLTNSDAGIAFFVGASTVGLHIDNVSVRAVP
jgi:hypothetical protein